MTAMKTLILVGHGEACAVLGRIADAGQLTYDIENFAVCNGKAIDPDNIVPILKRNTGFVMYGASEASTAEDSPERSSEVQIIGLTINFGPEFEFGVVASSLKDLFAAIPLRGEKRRNMVKLVVLTGECKDFETAKLAIRERFPNVEEERVLFLPEILRERGGARAFCVIQHVGEILAQEVRRHPLFR